MNGLGRGENQENQEKRSLLTKETAGMTLLLFGALALLIAVTRSLLFGEVGVAITAFLLGCFGYLTYPVLALLIYAASVMVFGKKLIPGKWIAIGCALVGSVFLIVHLATSLQYADGSYGSYLSACYRAGEGGVSTSTGGGFLFALIVFPFRKLLSAAGAFVVFSFLLAATVFFCLRATPFFDYIRRKTAAGRSERELASRGGTAKPYPVPVSFDELEQPARSAYETQGREAPAPAPSAPEPPLSPAEIAYRRSREILFDSDPATSYKNNLIFDRDSRFNNRERASSVTSVPTETAGKSYLSEYSDRAETPRPSMPRKIVEPSAPVDMPFDDDPIAPPSYKAAERENASTRDFYRNDVPTEFGEPARERFATDEPVRDRFTTDEPVRDRFVTDEPVRDRFATDEPVRDRFATDEPVRDRFTTDEPVRDRFTTDEPVRDRFATDEPVRDRFATDEPVRDRFTTDEPVRDRFATDEPARDRFTTDEPVRDRFTTDEPVRDRFATDEPARDRFTTEDGAEDSVRDREANFRNLFSRPVGNLRTPVEPTIPQRGENETDGFGGEAEETKRVSELFDDVEPDENFADESSRLSQRMRGEFPERAAREEDAEAPQPARHVYKPYNRPPLDLFRVYDDTVHVSPEETERNSAIILDTLAGFHVEAEIVGVTSGATVTRYDIDIPKNVASSSVIKRSEEIAMRLHAQNGVNVYTNWEKGAISIEVPNRSRATVGMKSVMESDAFRNTKPTALTFVIGKDIEGRSVCGNIDEMTHVLVAGTTGSGKSICLHALLTSLICKYSPEELRIILIDPKKNEFTIYDGIPHLMINEIITDAQKTVTTLNWAIKEMERRYALFNTKTMSGCAVRKIDEYNEKRTEDEEKLPKIVIVVDEFADLMSVAKKEIEERIQRLSQKARAAGIHLVIATQRPSVDVVTGVIKANLPSRIALRVTSEVDSRIMLDESGAEKLLGNGDLLFSVGGAKKTRAQGAFVSTAEAEAVVKFIKEHNESYFDENVSDYINTANQNAASSAGGEDDDGDGVDPQYIKALGMVVKLGSASISLIQRKCSVGYNHAGKIIDWMEVMGYISPFDGKAKARTVLLTKEEYESKYGSLD